MKVITTFSPKGGSGRTTTVLALACGFLEQGKKVSVMECTDHAGSVPRTQCPSTVLDWVLDMQKTSINRIALTYLPCRTGQQVADCIALARIEGFDILLIDTQSTIERAQLEAIGGADLILAPASGPFEARFILQGIDKYIDKPQDVVGVVTNRSDDQAAARRTRAAFGTHPAFKSELPCADVLANQIETGGIAQRVAKLACNPTDAGFGAYRDALAAWVAVQQLASEVQWALDGQRLQTYDADDHCA